jgi:hypothetical protein
MTDNEYGIKPIRFETVYDNKHGTIDDYIRWCSDDPDNLKTPSQEGFIDFIVEGFEDTGCVMPSI